MLDQGAGVFAVEPYVRLNATRPGVANDTTASIAIIGDSGSTTSPNSEILVFPTLRGGNVPLQAYGQFAYMVPAPPGMTLRLLRVCAQIVGGTVDSGNLGTTPQFSVVFVLLRQTAGSATTDNYVEIGSSRLSTTISVPGGANLTIPIPAQEFVTFGDVNFAIPLANDAVVRGDKIVLVAYADLLNPPIANITSVNDLLLRVVGTLAHE